MKNQVKTMFIAGLIGGMTFSADPVFADINDSQDVNKITNVKKNSSISLFKYLKNNDYDKFETLVKTKGVNLNVENKFGRTLFDVAKSKKDLRYLNLLLLSPSFDINSKDKDSYPAWVYVFGAQDAGITNVLKRPDLDINILMSDSVPVWLKLLGDRMINERELDLILARPDLDVNFSSEAIVSVANYFVGFQNPKFLNKLLKRKDLKLNYLQLAETAVALGREDNLMILLSMSNSFSVANLNHLKKIAESYRYKKIENLLSQKISDLYLMQTRPNVRTK